MKDLIIKAFDGEGRVRDATFVEFERTFGAGPLGSIGVIIGFNWRIDLKRLSESLNGSASGTRR